MPFARALFIASLISLSVSGIAAALADPAPLKLVSPARSALKQPATVQFSLEGDRLHARFEVRTPSVYGKPRLGPKEYPYMFDAVELFLTASGEASSLPYYELEVSAFAQQFQVRVSDAGGGKKRFEDGVNTGFDFSAARVAGGWNAELIVPLSNLGWSGDPAAIRGNAFGIFGKPGQRSYWALSMPAATKPNFHQPQFFVPLVEGPRP